MDFPKKTAIRVNVGESIKALESVIGIEYGKKQN
jgi:hypothetical protein